jgi:anthranilate phosphoribosyltransferase
MTDRPALQPVLARLARGARLTEAEAEEVFESIIAGSATPAQIGAILMALAQRGETVDELTAAVRTLRRHAVTIAGGADAIDCCGTGGDGHGTLNISTAVAFVVAGCGVAVAKHGNRAASSLSGAADVLTALGLKGDSSPAEAELALARHGLAFLFAPNHHPAMRAVAGLRRELGFRTLFNLAGPLANPAGTRRQLVGVYDPRWLEPVAEALRRLGSVSAWVVHGGDGLDELTITGPSDVAVLDHGRIELRRVGPEDAGLDLSPIDAIRGGRPAENAAAMLRLLDGEPGAYRDIVLLNAAAALIVAGRAMDLRAGCRLAGQSIDRGAARSAFDRLRGPDADMAS